MWNGKFIYCIKKCDHCGKEFKYPNFKPKTRFCSFRCFVNSGTISKNKERSKKISEALKGRKVTWNDKISKGRIGKKYPKLSEAKRGVKFSKKHKRKISEGQKKALSEGRKKMPIYYGSENRNWKGGISDENHKLRTSAKFKNWRWKVYRRDKYICQNCGDDRGGNLHPHHIKEWHKYPKLRFIINNGITLCKKCHQELHKGKNYGRDNQSPGYKAYFHRYFNRVSRL